MYYFDTSALVKRYVEEKGSQVIDQFFMGKKPILTASLAYPETYAAIYKIRRRGLISENQANASVALFESDWVNFTIIDFTEGIKETTPQLLKTFPLSGADGIHLASAVNLQKQGVDFHFVCSDIKLFNAAEDYGLKVIDPTRQ